MVSGRILDFVPSQQINFSSKGYITLVAGRTYRVTTSVLSNAVSPAMADTVSVSLAGLDTNFNITTLTATSVATTGFDGSNLNISVQDGWKNLAVDVTISSSNTATYGRPVLTIGQNSFPSLVQVATLLIEDVTQATVAVTAATNATIAFNNATTAANTATSAASTASTQATVASTSATNAANSLAATISQAALLMPERTDANGTYFYRASTNDTSSTGYGGAPSTKAMSVGDVSSYIVNESGYGPVWNAPLNSNLATQGVLPAIPNKVYEITAEWEVVTYGGSAVTVGQYVVGLDNQYSNNVTGSRVSTTATATGVFTHTVRWSSASGTNINAWGGAPSSIWLRPLFQFTSGSGSTVYFRRSSIRDVTAVVAAENQATLAAGSASAAATSASNASTSATNAGNSATSASNSATSAATSATTAGTSATNAQTYAGNAQTYANNASTSASNAQGSANTASTQAGVASTSASTAQQAATSAQAAAAALFPERFDGTGNNFTNFTAGNPSTVPSLPSANYVSVSGYGTVYQYTLPAVSSYDVSTNQVLPFVQGRVYQIDVELNVPSYGSSDTTGRFSISGRALDNNYADLGATGGNNVSVPASTVTIVSQTIAFNQAGTGAGLNATVANTIWLRPYIRYTPTNSSVSGTIIQYRRFKVTDVTSQFAAANSAAAAATSASNASTSATNAGNSATSASNSATSAATSATNAGTSATNANTYAGNAQTYANNASTSATNAAGSANTASTQAGVASSSASTATSAAQQAITTTSLLLPSRLDSSGTYFFDGSYIGDPATVSMSAAGQAKIVNESGYGYVYNYTQAIGSASYLAMIGVVPATTGLVYQIDVTWECVTFSSNFTMSAWPIWMGPTYAQVGSNTPSSKAFSSTGTQTLSFRISNTALTGTSWPSGSQTWPAGTSYVRILTGVTTAGSGSVVYLKSISVRDVTALAAAEAQATAASNSATAASTSASNASTSATNAGNSATAANTSAVSAASSYTNSVQNVAATLPQDFQNNGTFWASTYSGSPTRSSLAASAVYSFPTGNYVTINAAGNASSSQSYDVANLGALTLIANRIYTITANYTVTNVGSGGTATAQIYYIPLNASYSYNNGAAIANNITATGTFNVSITMTANTVLSVYSTAVMFRGLFRINTPAGVTGVVVNLNSVIIDDVTDSTNASNSATAAATSASNANTSATNAGTSATSAQTSATNASTSAGNAQTYANNASTSATNAQGYANTASSQAGVASTSATNAGVAAQAAGQAGQPSNFSLNGLYFTLSNQIGPSATSIPDSYFVAESAGNCFSTSSTSAVYPRPKWSLNNISGNYYLVTVVARALNANGTLQLFGLTVSSSLTTANLAVQSANTLTAGSAFQTYTFQFQGNGASPYLTTQVAVTAGSSGSVELLSLNIQDITAQVQAQNSASAAAGSASSASTSATNAGQSATSAQTSATNASTSAGNAQTYANNASTSATNAQGYANNASTSSGVASTSATNASNSAAQAIQTVGSSMPSDFGQGYSFWAAQSLAGTPVYQATVAQPSWLTFSTVSGLGPVAQITPATVNANAYWISNVGVLPILTGHQYQVTVTFRGAATSTGLFVQAYFCPLDSSYNSVSANNVAQSLNITDTTTIQTIQFTVDATSAAANGATFARLLLRAMISSGGALGGSVYFINAQIQDITSQTAAASYASAAATSASNASTSATNAGTSATSASNSATTATTQAGNASTSATSASTSATNAANSATAASTSATLSASIAAASLNANPVFGSWSGTYPDSWVNWSGSAPTKVAGATSPNAARLVSAANGQSGIYQNISSLTPTTAGQWIVMEADIILNSGALTGAGVLLQPSSGGNIILSFSTDKDVTDAVNGTGTAGNSYSFRKVVQITGTGNTVNRFYLMNHWGSIGSVAAANDITWLRGSVRFANQSEIASLRADANASTALANIVTEANTRATNDTAIANSVTALTATVTTNPNMVQNSTAANGVNGWTPGTTSGTSPATLPVVSATVGNNGEGSYFISTNGSGSSSTSYGIYQIIPVTGSAVYSLQAMLMATGVTGGVVRCFIDWKTSANAHISYSTILQVSAGSGWTSVSAPNLTAPSNAAFAYLYLDLCQAGSSWTNTNAGWKRIKLESGPICTIYTDDSTATQLSASVTTAQGAIATLQGQNQAWLTESVNAGTGRAVVSLQANGVTGTSNIDLQAGSINLYDGTTNYPVLTVSGGVVTMNGTLTVGSVGAAQLASNAVTPSKLAVSDVANYIQDPQFADNNYWTLGTGASFTTTDTTQLSAMAVNSAVKYVGNGTKTQSYVVASVSSAQKFTVEGSANYRLSFTYAYTSGFSGAIYAQIQWYKADGVTLSASPLSQLSAVDFRTTAATSAVNSASVTGFVTAPADALYASPQLVVLWSTTLNSAGTAYIAYPIFNRATDATLIPAATVTGSQIANTTITGGNIATGTITASKIAANTITGNNIAANTITTQNLVVAAGNLIANADFGTSDLTNWSPWSTPNNISVVANSTSGVPTGAPTQYVCKMAWTTGTQDIAIFAAAKPYSSVGASTDGFAVIPGQQYYVGISAAKSSDIAMAGTSQMRVIAYFWKSDGTYTTNTSAIGVAISSVTTSWADYTGSFTAPAGTQRCWLYVDMNSMTAGTFYFTNLRAWQMTSASLIVNGTITSTQIASNTITAGNIAANTITGDKLVLNSRGISVSGIDFQAAVSGTMTWTAGSIAYINSSGTSTTTSISAGSCTTANSYIYWVEGATTLSQTTSAATANANANIVMCVFNGGFQFNANYGGTVIDGSRITTNSITANQLAANTITANQIAAGTLSQNLIYNGSPDIDNLGSMTGWYTAEGSAFTSLTQVATSITGMGSYRFNLNKASAATTASAGTRPFQVVPGQKYIVTWTDGCDAATSSGKYVRLFYGASMPASGQLLSSNRSGFQDLVTGNSAWAAGPNNYSYTWTCPSGVHVASFVVYDWPNGPLNVYLDNVSVVCISTGATIIGPGTITADSLAVNSITANQIAVNSINASKIQIGEQSNYVLDGTFTDTLYWGLAPGVTANSTDSAVVSSLNAAYALKSNTGNGTTSQGTETSSQQPGQYMIVEPNMSYRFQADYLMTSGFTGIIQIAIDWFKGDGVTSAGSSTVYSSTDYRTTALASQTIGGFDNIITVPATATNARYRIITTWSTTLSNSGNVYLTRPRFQRAAGGELIVNGAVTATKIAANTITAGNIAAGAITASRLNISGNNLVLDDEFTDVTNVGSYWGSVSSFISSDAAPCTALNTPSVIKWAPGNGATSQTGQSIGQNGVSNYIDVEPGKAYRIAYQTYIPNGFTGVCYFTCYWYQKDGTTLISSANTSYSDYRVTAYSGSATVQSYDNLVTSPTNAAYLRIVFQISWSTTLTNAGQAYSGNPIVMRSVSGELIVDGTISATKLIAGSITANQIGANSITASKLIVGDVTNYVQDPNFTDTNYWQIVGTGGSYTTASDSTALTAMSVATGFKSVGNGTKTQGYSYIQLANGQLFSVEGSGAYRLSCSYYYTSGFTGMAFVQLAWYKADGATPSATQSLQIYGTDFRTTAASAAGSGVVDGIVAAPSDALYARAQLVILWSTTLNSAGTGYIGYPIINRAYAGNLIVDGSVTATKIAAGTITANNLAANSITASKLVVGDVANYIQDPNFADSAYWSLANGVFSTTDTTPMTAMAVQRVFKTSTVGTSARAQLSSGQKFSIEGGVAYRCNMAYYAPAGFTGAMYFLMSWYKADGVTPSATPYNIVFTSVDGRTTALTSVQTGSSDGQVVAPGDALFAVPALCVDWSTTLTNAGVGYFGYPVVNRAVGTNLIVDGSILATKIATGTLTATQIAANTITAAQIAANTITATQIAANTITASQIAANTITTNQIAANTIVAGNIASGTITATQIAAGTITGDRINSSTSLPASLTIGTSGFSLSTLGSAAANSDTLVSPNPRFSAWSGSLPDGFAVWSSGTVTKVAGTVNTNAARVVTTSGNDGGMVATPLATSFFNGTWVVIEADIILNSGSMIGAGMLVRGGGGNSGDAILKFAVDPDIRGTVQGAGSAGGVYSFRKVMQVPSGSNNTCQLYLMNHWTSISSTAAAADITWLRAGFRFASSTEINPANQINANTTQINPGLILISGSTSLLNWRNGTDTTKIEGGSIAANTITANKMTIGNRGINFIDIPFQVTNNGTTLTWGTGYAQYVSSAGAGTQVSISSGSITPGGTSYWYVYWTEGATSFTTSVTQPAIDNAIIVCVWQAGQKFCTPTYGSTIIDGSRITTGTVTATQIAAGTITASNIAASSITADKLSVYSTGTNMIANSGFENGDSSNWGIVETSGNGGNSSIFLGGAISSGSTCLNVQKPAASDGVAIGSYRMPTSPGRVYRLRLTSYMNAAVSTGYYLRIMYAGASLSGLIINSGNRSGYTDLISNGSHVNGSQIDEFTWTAPAGANWASVAVYNWTSSSATVLAIDDVQFAEQTTTLQIANGAVTATQIAANTITAGQIAAGTITGDRINSSTSLPASLTVGSTGFSLGTIQSISSQATGPNRIQFSLFESNQQFGTPSGGDYPWWAPAYNPNSISTGGQCFGFNGHQILKVNFTATAANQTISIEQGVATDPVSGTVNIKYWSRVTPGEWIWFGGYVETSNCSVGITVTFYQSNGSTVSAVTPTATTGGFTNPGFPSNANVSWEPWRRGAFVQVPSDTAFARMQYYGTTTASGTGFFSIAMPMLCGIVGGSTVAPPFNAGPTTSNPAYVINNNSTTISGGMITTGSITANQIASNTITAGQIAANTITAGQIAANTITAGQIAAGTITATQIAANTITTNQIAANTIVAADIAANTITAGQIAAGTITATQIASGSITADRLSVSSLSAISGTIGTLQSGTSGQRYVLTDSYYRWYDSNNVLRVEIGVLS